MNTVTLPVSRAASIAAAITTGLMDSYGDTSRATLAREDAQTASANATAGREILMGTLASASLAGGWHANEIDEAMNLVAKSINDDKARKTMATLISEVKHAAYPNGRRDFAALVNARNVAWDSEDAEKKAAKEDKRKPNDLLSRAFSRRYQTLVAMLRAVNETDPAKQIAYDITTEAGLLGWAESRDPLRSPKNLAERVESVRETLADISRLVGGHESTLAAVVNALGFVSENTIATAFAGPNIPEDVGEDDLSANEGATGAEITPEVSGSDNSPNEPAPQVSATPFSVPRVVISMPVSVAQPVASVQNESEIDDLLLAATA